MQRDNWKLSSQLMANVVWDNGVKGYGKKVDV